MPDFNREGLAKLYEMLDRYVDLLIDEPAKTHLTPEQEVDNEQLIAEAEVMCQKVQSLLYPP